MSFDEFRPNPPAPVFRRALRLEVDRNGSTTSLTVEDPQSAAEVTGFFDIVRAVFTPEVDAAVGKCSSIAPLRLTSTTPATLCEGPAGHPGDHADCWPPSAITMRWGER